MKKTASLVAIKPIVLFILSFVISVLFFTACFAQVKVPDSRISKKIAALQQKGSFSKELAVFTLSAESAPDREISAVVKKYTLLNTSHIDGIQHSKPAYIRFSIPVDNGGRLLKVLLYKENISPNGFTLLTDKGSINAPQQDIVHYRGSVEDDLNSVAAFTFAGNEVSGFINNSEGNYVIGKTNNAAGKHIIYNDMDLITKVPFDCATNTFIPVSPVTLARQEQAATATTKCINWYWETDYDMFVNKGSVTNVNAYMQAIFNEMATLYANDGITMTLKTLFVWTTEDPYTGPNTSDYLNQFGAYRTSFDGDLAHLVGLKGNGGIAWINGLCKATKYKMAYSGISSTYKTVPTYSWSVECITHEQGHLLGSPHTHDCSWNGNNTKIDGCGDAAGYPSGSCPVPSTLPVGGGTIMSYCHLTSAGINLNLGFGPQPTALMINTINAASCLVACTSCAVPSQPGIITGTNTVCAGSTQTYSVKAVSGATSYTWSLPTGWTGSSTTDSITVTAGSAGGTISVAANNSCGSSTAQTFTATVATLPVQPGTISGNAAVCAGSSQTYSVTAVAGATSYTWALPSGWTGVSTTNTVIVTTGSTGGSISVKANNSCGTSAATTTAVTVTSVAPAQPSAITGNTTACPGTTQTYSVMAVAGATSYTWALPSGWTGTSVTNSITTIAGSAGGTISVKANNICGSGTAKTTTVTVSATPAQPGTISGNTAVCAGSSQTYSVTAVAGATSYTWALPSGWTGTSTGNTITVTTGVAGGSLSVKTNNSCGSSALTTATVTITSVAPSQPSAITGNTAACAGTAQTYSVTTIAGATSYTWILPSGWTGTSVTNSITATVGSAGGIISVKANNSCGSGTTQSTTVSVAGLPAQPGTISGNTAVCAGTSQTYSVTAVAGATSYTWALPSGWTGTSVTNSITTIAGSAGGTISVKANNICGSGTAKTTTVTVSATPAQPGTISGNTAVCAGSSQTYSVTAVAGATSYTWALPSGWTGTSTGNTITVTTGVTGGSLSVKTNNSCGSSAVTTATVTINSVAPSQPSAITGNTTACAGTTQTYSVTAIASATSYTWALPSGWTGTSATNSITATAGSAGGIVSVKANNSCGSSAVQTTMVSIAAMPAQPGTISGNAAVCAGTTQTYSVIAVAGVTSYTWALPGGWTGTSVTNSITTTAGSAGGTISVKTNNSCGSSTSQTATVTVAALPAQPGAISGNTAVCGGISQTYSVSAVAGATSYTWALPAGWTGTSTSNTITVTTGATGGSLSVKANNTCGSSGFTTTTIAITSSIPSQPTAITGSTAACAGTTQIYSVTSVAGATSYTWALPSGWTGTSATNSITATAGSAGGIVSVKANNSCGSSAVQTTMVSIAAMPAQPGTISGNAAVCAGTTQTYSVIAVAGATSYTWALPLGWTGTSINNAITVTTGAAGGLLSVQANNSCGTSSATTISLAITSIAPLQPGSITGNTTVCAGSTQTYSVTAVTGVTSYTWTLPAGWAGSSTTSSITTVTGSAGGTISVSANNGCGSSPAQTLAAAISSLPGTPGAITVSGGTAAVCTGDVRTYTIPFITGITYNWVAPSGSTISSGQGTNSIQLSFSSSFVSGSSLRVTAVNSCGVSASSANFTISKSSISRPGIIIVSGGSSRVCPGDVRSYTVSAAAGITYNWTVPTGSSIITGQGTKSIQVAYTGNFTTQGIISVTANNNCGTSSPRTLTVSRNTLSTPALMSGSTNVCANAVNTYSVLPVSGTVSYIWTVPTGATIQGASTGNSIQVKWGSTGGSVTVVATNACGNSDARSKSVSISCLSAIQEFSGEMRATVYPNPSHDLITVRFSSPDHSTYAISITDMMGRIIVKENMAAIPGINLYPFDLSKISKGIYVIAIQSKAGKQLLKVNVE